MRRDTINKEEYRRRTIEMAERQNWLCAICGTWMTEPTFDHEAGRGIGGGHRDDSITHSDGSWRNAALCIGCNGHKGSRRYSWVDGVYVPTSARS